MSYNHISARAIAGVSQLLAKKNIYLYGTRPGALQTVKYKPVGDTSRFGSVVYSKEHVTAINSQDALNKEHHPYREKTILRYLERDDPFWWNVVGKAELSPKVVRGWGIRRTIVAFRGALQRRGYDKDGNVLKDAPTVMGQKPEKNLYGTMLFMVSKETVTASFEELNNELDVILDAAIQLASRPGKKPAANSGIRNDQDKRKRVNEPQRERSQKVDAGTPTFTIRNSHKRGVHKVDLGSSQFK